MATNSTNTANKRAAEGLPNYVGPTDPRIDAEARERLITARIGLLLRHAFFGNLATRLKLTNADEWLQTAATDGVHFYYNSRFIMAFKSTKEVEFLVGHEVLHVAYDHMGRRDFRDPQIWNVAADYAINADLKKHKVGQFVTSVPCLYEQKYEGKSAEEIYEDLMKNVKKITLEQLAGMLLDEHMEDGSDDGEDDGDGEANPGKGKRPKAMTEEEKADARQSMREAILSAASTCDAGQIPAGIARMIKDITDPVMPWRELIQTNLTSAIRTDFSWMRPSRRGWDMDAIMPGMTPGEEIDVVVTMDMSGSISPKQAQDFLSEIAGMTEAFDGFKLHVFCFDTEIYNPRDFTSENMDDINEYEPQGGGGTDFECVFEYLRENGIEPKRLIFFTDGYPCGSWGPENYCDVTWIIHGNNDIVPPWGSWAYYNDHRQ